MQVEAMTQDDNKNPNAKTQSIPSSVNPNADPVTQEQDINEIEAEYQELMNDLRSLVQYYRSTARMFPDDSNASRVAAHCADKLEETLEDYPHE